MPGLGNARLAIPRVNQRPRIAPAKPVRSHRTGLAQAVAVAQSPATTTQGSTVPATQSEPTDPFAAVPTPPAPKAPRPWEIPAWSGPGEDPRDATYWKNVNNLKFSGEQREAEVLREQTRTDTDYYDALQTAIRNRLGQQRELGESAIRGNLGASGWLNRTEGEQTLAYTQDRSHALLNKEEEDQARVAARRALQEGFSIEEAGERGEAAARLVQLKREEALNAPPETPPTTPPEEEKKDTGKTAGKGKNQVGISGNRPAPPGAVTQNTPIKGPVKEAIGNAIAVKRKKGKR